mmetsp:Transcript_22824/g.90507  ORF Transcript_22824/g.90507 Transcript_22824/m.90507 type:complete len:211 (+) Transcript_22824:515-1147(+)
MTQEMKKTKELSVVVERRRLEEAEQEDGVREQLRTGIPEESGSTDGSVVKHCESNVTRHATSSEQVRRRAGRREAVVRGQTARRRGRRRRRPRGRARRADLRSESVRRAVWASRRDRRARETAVSADVRPVPALVARQGPLRRLRRAPHARERGQCVVEDLDRRADRDGLRDDAPRRGIRHCRRPVPAAAHVVRRRGLRVREHPRRRGGR